MGPIELGQSNKLVPAWDLIHRLQTLIQWGQTSYKDWWMDHVFAYYLDTLKHGRQFTMSDAQDLGPAFTARS